MRRVGIDVGCVWRGGGGWSKVLMGGRCVCKCGVVGPSLCDVVTTQIVHGKVQYSCGICGKDQHLA